MKKWQRYASLLLVLVLCLSMAACGGKVSIKNLEGYWYPIEGIGATASVLTCIYLDGTAGTWEEYDIYGAPTGNTGDAYTDGTVLTLADVPWCGDVEIPIGDEDTLVTDTGDIYWIKGKPDFKKKPELSSDCFGRWYLRGDRDSEYVTILTLNEDGTYTKGDVEEGTYTYSEFEQTMADTGTTVFRQEISLSGLFMAEDYYLVSDGQALIYWSSDGDNYYIREDALDNADLLMEYDLMNGSYWGRECVLRFSQGYIVTCEYPYETSDVRTGTWELEEGTVLIVWDDGETDEAVLSGKSLWLSSTGETLENPW